MHHMTKCIINQDYVDVWRSETSSHPMGIERYKQKSIFDYSFVNRNGISYQEYLSIYWDTRHPFTRMSRVHNPPLHDLRLYHVNTHALDKAWMGLLSSCLWKYIDSGWSIPARSWHWHFDFSTCHFSGVWLWLVDQHDVQGAILETWQNWYSTCEPLMLHLHYQ